MYEISGVYGEKFMTGGQVIRTKSAFKQYLSTEEGVVRFLDEMQPFSSISIKNMETKKDVTEYFTGSKDGK